MPKEGGIQMKKFLIIGIVIVLIAIILVFIINTIVTMSTKNQIISRKEATQLDSVDCIIVLGAGIWGNSPSPMLEDRLNEAIALYNENVSAKIVVSGDHGKVDYDEVNVMKNYAIEKGVPSENIFMDHAGFSSYESIYRVKEIFGAKKIVVVTQKYHLFRALYIANQLDIEAYGVNSDPRRYVGASYRELREVIARNKDFFGCILKVKPTYLGEYISLDGNGDITNDKTTVIRNKVEKNSNNIEENKNIN